MSWVIMSIEEKSRGYYAGGNDIDEPMVWVNSCDDAYKFNYEQYADAFICKHLNKYCVSMECKA